MLRYTGCSNSLLRAVLPHLVVKLNFVPVYFLNLSNKNTIDINGQILKNPRKQWVGFRANEII